MIYYDNRVKNRHYEQLILSYTATPFNLEKMVWKGEKHLKKSIDKMRVISPPVSMEKLINLLEMDEYHYACVDAISESCFVKFGCKNERVRAFFDNIQLPAGEDVISTFSDFIHYYIACGNGFLLKMRNLKGDWVGFSRLIPDEVMILEQYDEFGFLKPDYLQVKNGLKTYFPNRDIIHILQRNSLSNAWGLACKPIILNIEALSELKQYDFNRFKNGLLVDYFIIIEGGGLGEKYTEIGANGDEHVVDPYEEFTRVLANAKGTANSHGSIFIETADPNSRVRLEPMRITDNNFGELKKDLREGVIVYHRVPHRLISQETPGKLGGDNNSDMTAFYNMVVKPIQSRVARILATEFKSEFGWSVSADDFDFGNITEIFENFETTLFRQQNQNNFEL